MLTKKHYSMLCATIRRIEDKECRQQECEKWINFCKADNALFDEDKFIPFCGV